MTSKTFQGSADRYGGITIDSEKESCEPDQFQKHLTGKFTQNDHFTVHIFETNYINDIKRLKEICYYNRFRNFTSTLIFYLFTFDWLKNNFVTIIIVTIHKHPNWIVLQSICVKLRDVWDILAVLHYIFLHDQVSNVYCNIHNHM